MSKKFTVDNITLYLKKPSTILQACEDIGLFIPRFCYSESLSIAGNCRMCLVEIEKSPKLMPACAIKVAPDMKIYTKTNLVKKTRENILEFLLINHPLDCPICDQGGECDLQDQAMVYGSDRGRFYEYKRAMEDKNGGPLIKTIMTRCIHCTRCIRFATEIAGVEVYGTAGRGKGMQVGTYISTLFNSELSGNVIDLCPVGALTSKPYAFTVRPWELKSIESIDVLDAIGSNIRIDVRGTELMRILPKANNNINQQWITDKTRFSYDGIKNQRLNYPMKRIPGTNQLVQITWKEALTIVKEKVTSPSKITGVIGKLVDQSSALLFKKFIHTCGSSEIYLQPGQQEKNLLSTNVDVDFRCNYIFNTYQLAAQINGTTQQKTESDTNMSSLSVFDNMPVDYVLLIGTNPRYEASLFNVRLRSLFLNTPQTQKLVPTIASIGAPMDLTFEHTHLGNGMKTLWDLAYNKDFNRNTCNLVFSMNPLCFIGINSLQRIDGNGMTALLHDLFANIQYIKYTIFTSIFGNTLFNAGTTSEKRLVRTSWKKVLRSLHTIAKKRFLLAVLGNNVKYSDFAKTDTDEITPESATWLKVIQCRNTILINTRRYQILHSYANTVGSLDLACQPNIKHKLEFNQKKGKDSVLYLLGADYAQLDKASKHSGFVIYQGHHGDFGAKNADLILPSTCYVEKQSRYVNTEGRTQETQVAIPSTHRDDWKILYALFHIIASPQTNQRTPSNIVLNSLYDLYSESSNQDILPFSHFGKDIIKQVYDLDENCHSLFNHIAPHLNSLGQFESQLIDTNSNNLFAPSNMNKLYNTNFYPLFENFYLTDVIGRASITMGKASREFHTH